jgi:hypothetical protein
VHHRKNLKNYGSVLDVWNNYQQDKLYRDYKVATLKFRLPTAGQLEHILK